MTTPLLRTSLYDAHRAANARLVPFAGWEMPVQYKGVLDEVKAVRGRVGLFDVSHMGRIRVHGHRALDYLQYLVVSDVAALPEEGGRGQYSLLCKEDGGIIDDIIVYRLGIEEFLIVVNAANRDKDLAWMQHHAARFDLVLEDETDATALIAVQGPKAVSLIDSLSDRELTMLPRFGLDETVLVKVQTMAARTGYTGEDGFELFCRADQARLLWDALVQLGAQPCGLGARDTLRLEAALPLYGHEMDESVNPFEARLSWVVKTVKDASFLGKKALTQFQAAPRQNILVGLEMEDRAIPREGYSIHTIEGKEIGRVTSGTFSPMRNKGIALARVEAAKGTKGATLAVMVRDTPHPARVVGLPFYKNV